MMGEGSAVVHVEFTDAARPGPRSWLTRAMGQHDEEGAAAVSLESEAVDVDGDGAADIVTEVTTVVADLDGDGVIDVVEQTTASAYDLDGDGVPDAVDRTTIT